MIRRDVEKSLRNMWERGYKQGYEDALKEGPVPFDFELFQAGLMDMPEGMTNGEVIKALFPNETLHEQTPTCTYYGNMRFDTEWWNAPYKKEVSE